MEPRSLSSRVAVPADVPEIVRVHLAAFKGFFLSDMGPMFLSAYYGMVFDYEQGICIVCEDGKGIIGFVSGSVRPEGFYELMRSRKRSLILPSIVGIARNPRLLPRLVANTRRVESGEPDGASPSGIGCELASIAVHPDAMGTGIGKQLVEAFISEARRRGAGHVYLTTDAEENDRVNSFYQKLGFRLTGTLTSDGKRTMNKYVLELVSPDA